MGGGIGQSTRLRRVGANQTAGTVLWGHGTEDCVAMATSRGGWQN